MTGQSTFFVELAETAAMLQRATSRCGCVHLVCGLLCAAACLAFACMRVCMR